MGHRFFSGLTWNLLGTLSTVLLNVVQVLWLVRLLDRADFALFALAAVPVNLGLQLQEGGINTAIVQRPDPSPQALASLYWLNLAIGGLLFVTMAAAGLPLASVYHAPSLSSVLGVYGLFFLINAFGVQYKALMEKALRFSVLNLCGTAATLVGVVASIVLAERQAGVYALVGGQLARAVAENLLSIVLGRRHMRGRWVFDRQAVRPYVAFSRYHLPERLMTTLFYQLDILLIGRWLGADALGAYDVFKRALARPGSLLSGAVERAAFPLLSRLQGQTGAFRRSFQRLLGGLGAILFPGYLLLGLLAHPVIRLLFGADWLAYTAVFQALCLLMGAYVFTHPIDSVLLARGEARRLFWLQLLPGPLIAGAIWLGAAHGLTGVVMGLTAAQVIFILFSYQVVLRRIGLWKGGDVMHTVFPPLALSLVCGAAVYPWYPFTAGWDSLVLVIFVYSLLYLVFSRWFNPLAAELWRRWRPG